MRYTRGFSSGFALPTVLIASVVMLGVLAATLSTVTATRTAVQNQLYTQLARDAANSGAAMARACIDAGTATWANPLRPGSTCSGLAAQCGTASCYLTVSGEYRTTFEVATPDVAGAASTIKVTGKVERLRASSGSVWRTYTQTVQRQESSGGSAVNTRWKQVVGGATHTCALSTEGLVYCWGTNANGELGDGTTTTRQTPTLIAQGAIPSGATIQQIDAGSSHTCAIASDNKTYCWGLNTNGRLGDSSTTTRTSPVAVSLGAMPTGGQVRSISLGFDFSCAISTDERGYCWGNNASNQLGDGTTTQRTSPVQVSQGAMPSGAQIRQINSGGGHACALAAADSRAYCWGYNLNGRLGDGTSTQRSTAVQVSQGAMPTGAQVVQILAAGSHSCAIAVDNRAYCWGLNSNGQLGDNSTTSRTTPVAVAQGQMDPARMILSIVGGGSHTCATVNDGYSYCWGLNSDGQLGDASTTQRTTPVSVAQGAAPTSLYTMSIGRGVSHSCAIAVDDNLYCWGDNAGRQLGDGTTTDRTSPILVPTVTGAGARPLANLQLPTSASGNHSCVIGSDRWAYCWGSNANGQLGDGTTTSRSVPTKVAQGAIPVGLTLTSISEGTSFTCATATNGWVYCWGLNTNGQLGDGSTTQRTTPVAINQGAIANGVGIMSISLGATHSCAIDAFFRPFCWGANGNGQLGDNSTTQRTSPVAVLQGALPSVSVRKISAGTNFTCAISQVYRPYCWGLNSGNQLGDNTTTQRTTAVAVSQGAMAAGVLVRDITSGSLHACAIAADSRTYCWGTNTYSQLGDNTTTIRPTPVAVAQGALPSGQLVKSVTAGDTHTCVISAANLAYCWGRNNTNQLGDNSTTTRATPVAVSQGSMPASNGAQAIFSAAGHSCIIGRDNIAYCWGLNGAGQLGDNTTTNRATPVTVTNIGPYVTGAATLQYF